MLTRSGWVLVGTAALLLVAGWALGLPELDVLGATGLVVVAAALVAVRRRRPELLVERLVHPRRVHAGGTSRVELRISNQGPRRSPVLNLHDPVEGTVGAHVALAPLAVGELQAASYRLPTHRRGLVRIGPLEARRSDPFGLAARRSPVAGEAVLTVLPAIEDLGPVTPGGGLHDPLTHLARPVLGTAGEDEFATLRPYVVGDDLRRVHWASSARAGDLLVRQDDPPWQGHLTVILDARSARLDDEQFETAVSAAASLLDAVASRTNRARLVFTDGTDTGLVDARTGRDVLLERLALVGRHAAGRLPDIAADGRSRSGGLIIISGAPEPEVLAALAAHRRRFASARLVSIVAAPGHHGAPGSPVPSELDPDVVTVTAGHSFATAWRSSLGSDRAPR